MRSAMHSPCKSHHNSITSHKLHFVLSQRFCHQRERGAIDKTVGHNHCGSPFYPTFIMGHQVLLSIFHHPHASPMWPYFECVLGNTRRNLARLVWIISLIQHEAFPSQYGEEVTSRSSLEYVSSECYLSIAIWSAPFRPLMLHSEFPSSRYRWLALIIGLLLN